MKDTIPDLRIFPLSSVTAPGCINLARREFGADSPQFRAVFDFTKQKRAGYIATLKNRVVGFVIQNNRNYERAEILAFAVEKSVRRQGIGRRLLQRVTRLPRKEVSLKVSETSLEPQLFLRSQGFPAVKIEHGPHRDFYIFKKVTESQTTSQHDVFPSQLPTFLTQIHVQTNH